MRALYVAIIACHVILGQKCVLNVQIILSIWSMANAYVQTRLSSMAIRRHVWGAMSHALRAQSQENAILVQMVSLLERISVLHVIQINT